MDTQTFNAMLKELDDDKGNILQTISKSQELIQHHEGIIKEYQQKLAELETGMQFIRKRFLREEPEPISISEHDNVNISEKTSLVDLQLDAAVKSVLDNEPDRKFTVREVTETLLKQNYPTRAGGFSDVVSNNLRTLASEEKIGSERFGKNERFVRYFSLKNQQKQSTIFFPKTRGIQRGTRLASDIQN